MFKKILLATAMIAIVSLAAFAVFTTAHRAYAMGGTSDSAPAPTKIGAGGKSQPYNPQGKNGGQYETPYRNSDGTYNGGSSSNERSSSK